MGIIIYRRDPNKRIPLILFTQRIPPRPVSDILYPPRLPSRRASAWPAGAGRGADGHMGAGDVAEGGAARHIGPVGEGLDRDAGFFADIPEHGGGDAVSTVLLAGVEFQHDAFVEIGPVGRIGLVRMVRVYGVGVVCGEHEAFRQADEVVLAAKAQAAADPLQRI